MATGVLARTLGVGVPGGRAGSASHRRQDATGQETPRPKALAFGRPIGTRDLDAPDCQGLGDGSVKVRPRPLGDSEVQLLRCPGTGHLQQLSGGPVADPGRYRHRLPGHRVRGVAVRQLSKDCRGEGCHGLHAAGSGVRLPVEPSWVGHTVPPMIAQRPHGSPVLGDRAVQRIDRTRRYLGAKDRNVVSGQGVVCHLLDCLRIDPL